MVDDRPDNWQVHLYDKFLQINNMIKKIEEMENLLYSNFPNSWDVSSEGWQFRNVIGMNKVNLKQTKNNLSKKDMPRTYLCTPGQPCLTVTSE